MQLVLTVQLFLFSKKKKKKGEKFLFCLVFADKRKHVYEFN